VKNLNFILCNFGNVLATRAQGARAAELLRERSEENPVNLVLNFAAVDAVTPPFLDELLHELYRALRRQREDGGFAVVVNINEDDLETLRMVLDVGDWPGLMHATTGGTELLSRSPQLADTLRAARELGPTFTAPQLAEFLSLKVPNANHRLTQLVEAGALARRRDDTAEHGKRYEYEAPTDEVVGAMLEHGALLTAAS
jgi:hypothetical protein